MPPLRRTVHVGAVTWILGGSRRFPPAFVNPLSSVTYVPHVVFV